MPDEPMVTNTQDLANAEYDAERWARVHDQQRAEPKRPSASAAVGENKSEGHAERLPADKPKDR